MAYHNVMKANDFNNLIQKDPQFLIQYMLEIAQASRECPDSALIIPYTSILRNPPANVYISGFGHLFGTNITDGGLCRQEPLPSWWTVLEKIQTWAPEMNELSFEGYVCAGSYPVLACQWEKGKKWPGDADFYPFYDPSNLVGGDVHNSVMQSYQRFLKDLEDYMGDNKEYKATIKRNENCTTICREHGFKGNISELQIVHRAHTSPRSVVVGFDQMACKAFFDGEMIYFTIDAALCLFFGINPVDWRRESPNHLRRTSKYAYYGYVPIFPGLPFSLGKELKISCEKAFDNSNIDNDARDNYTYGYSLPGETILRAEKAHIKEKRTGKKSIFSNDHHFRLKLFSNYEYPQEDKEQKNDYDDDTTDILMIWYYAVSRLIVQKPVVFTVFSNRPTEILTKPSLPNIRTIIEKVAGGPKANFYFGNIRTREISIELSKLSVRKSNWTGFSGRSVKCLSFENLERYTALQQEYHKLIEARIVELEEMITPEHKKLLEGVTFKISNPGAQFTSSFKPINRVKPQDYWGPAYVPFDHTQFQRMKFTLLLIRRFRDHPIRILDLSAIKLLFRHLYVAHFTHWAASLDKVVKEYPGDKILSRIIKLEDIGNNEKYIKTFDIIHQRLPWNDKPPK